MNQAEFQALRVPLFILLVIGIVGALAIYYSDQVRVTAQQQLARQQGQLADARTRLQKSGEEKDLIVRYLDEFRRLERTGFIGEEQRINWLDGLRRTNQRTGLFGVEYQINPQKPYAYSSALNTGQIALYQSVTHLKFSLLHEEDLLRFFDALESQVGGIFAIDQCALRRTDSRRTIRYQPNVQAECDISWITAKVPSGTEPKKP